MKKLLLSALVVLVGFYADCTRLTINSQIDVLTRAPLAFHCPPRTIRVSFDNSFSDHEKFLVKIALLNYERLGIHVQFVTENQEVQIRRWAGHHCQDDLLGITHQNYVLIDPACTSSEQQLQVVVFHEIGHWLGMQHVCQPNLKTTDVCSPVGYGWAVLNPYVGRLHPLQPTRLDEAEYTRGCWIRTLQSR